MDIFEIRRATPIVGTFSVNTVSDAVSEEQVVSPIAAALAGTLGGAMGHTCSALASLASAMNVQTVPTPTPDAKDEADEIPVVFLPAAGLALTTCSNSLRKLYRSKGHDGESKVTTVLMDLQWAIQFFENCAAICEEAEKKITGKGS